MAISTDVPIYTTTLSSSATSINIDLSSYQQYKNLKIVTRVFPTTNFGPNIYFRFNGDTGSHYSWNYLYGNGSTTAASRGTSQTQGLNFASSPTLTGYIDTMYIMDYSSSSIYKTIFTRSGDSGNQVNIWSNAWRGATGSSTEAITSVSILTSSDSFAAGTTISVYGIGSATPSAKATGGAIYTDTDYVYHVFGSTGTFVANQTLTADVLVVAGGGGGGRRHSGGAGAGGVCWQSGRSITAGSYTATIGAGGTGSPTSATNGGVGTSGGNTTFSTITANGGGYGGAWGTVAASGGSGGGATIGSPPGVLGTPGSATQGNSGGATGYGNSGGTGIEAGGYFGGGGGGAGAAGQAGNSTNGAGDGGNGISSGTIAALLNIYNATGVGQLSNGVAYIGGGGGGGQFGGTGYGGDAGLGGGGLGINDLTIYSPLIDGKSMTGGGGGSYGSANNNDGYRAGNGGSGVVIVRYAK